ncbi:MAG: outer membrane protein assembly factor BamE [Pseudomonadota bacterium]|jgi:outer membrane protein assembly factor BamE (lipoprotein component of BamABCDE complex)
MALRKSHSFQRIAARCLVGATLAMGLAACSSTTETLTKGYVIDERVVAEIKPGTSVEKVLERMGTPSTVSTVGNKTFYYISQTFERPVQFMRPRLVDQRVLAIYFDKNFKVERLANYGLKDGVVFDFITRTTPTSGSELSLIGQLLRATGSGGGGPSFNPFGA